ncbi:LamG-like jellyroll fold domain-containing protein [Streptomyces sp. DH24]|uniref:LamG-like jellyroll fold domain-containing protein n=1 Tax=Streptomyces sp. DH24 TaxID=3040123 RepID=UPI00244295B4|nr:LamG-like jellyroll fold domain-containing protein [Streptomyces sp. DH24]MDG9717396.1 hypothetical protein [Streptomyces sp. DH24]
MALLVEMGWGGLVQAPTTITWTDISSYVDVLKQGVAIRRGAADELSETQPGSATLRLDNQDGRFTPGNAASPYYPYVRRNAPIRISVAVIPTRSGPAPYPLAMLGDDFDAPRLNSSLWTNAYGGAGVVGGRARIPLTPGVGAGLQSAREWRLPGSSLCARLPTLPAANGSSSARANWTIDSSTSGTRLGFQYNAVAQTLRCINEVSFSDGASVDLPYSAIDHLWVRIRESTGTVYWETSGDGFGWTVRRTLATPSWATADTLMVSMTTARTGGTADYIEWDLLGATVRPRFWGMVNEWPVDWEGLVSTVTVTATDLFKRLNRLPPLRPMLAEEIIADRPLAYYPMTEPTDSTSCGDLSGAGRPALVITQAGSGGTLTPGTDDGPPATGGQQPTFTPASATAGKYLAADLGSSVADAVSNGFLAIEAWVKTTTASRAILGLASSSLSSQIVLTLSSGGQLQVEWTADAGPLQVQAVGGPALTDGSWHHVLYEPATGDVWIDGVLVNGDIAVPAADLRLLQIGGWRAGRLWAGSIGHVAVYAPSPQEGGLIGESLVDHWNAGANGYAGERADQRIQRLARYAGLSSVTVWGATHDPVAGQGEGGRGVVARMREVESTESARLYAERDWYGLGYQSRDLRYNPDPSSEVFTISYADLETSRVQLADDDQKLVNDVEASRPGGATQRVTAPASVLAFGAYPQQLSVLKTSDNSVLDAAYWLVSRYANPGPELREVAVEAHTMPNYLDILDADISSYFSVYDLPAQAPASALRVTVEGYAETIKEASHLIQFHTSASANDSVWVLDDATYSVLDSTTRLAY